MLKNVQKIDQQIVEKTWFQRFRTPLAVGSILATGTSVANAADVDTLFTGLATDLGGVSTGTLSVVVILAGVTALLIGWAYFKKVR